MNSHDWKTPLVQFRLNEPLIEFWKSVDAKRLRDFISIKPDKFKGMMNCLDKGAVWITCTTTQFSYIVIEYLTYRPNHAIWSLKPKLLMPPKRGHEFDIVHSSSCYMFGDD